MEGSELSLQLGVGLGRRHEGCGLSTRHEGCGLQRSGGDCPEESLWRPNGPGIG